MIELKGISKSFGSIVAIDDVTVSFEKGERVAVIGENGAGKSSLMNVLYGLYQPDRGSIVFDGTPAVLASPREAIRRGVGMVHQHFTLVPSLTVTENVILGAEPSSAGVLLNLDAARAAVKKTCETIGFALEVDALVESLTVGSQQKVEILKALHRGVDTLILDEPTAVLTPQETIDFFKMTRTLSERGMTVVLISHKLKDVLAFAQRVVVMRRGKKVAETQASETNADALAHVMIGERQHPTPASAAEKVAGAPANEGAVALAVEQLSAVGLRSISMEARAGEILGVAGVDGNGQRELAEVLTGLRTWHSGAVRIGSTTVHTLTPAQAHTFGIAHIPEDRHHRAAVLPMTVEENVALGRHREAPFSKGVAIDRAGRRAKTLAILEANDVRPRDPLITMGALSGGNQQKLVVGRELDRTPKVLIAVQPTRGLDLVAVEAVRAKLLDAARGGAAVILISLDLDEVLSVSDRIVVLYAGAISGSFGRAQFDETLIGQRMLGLQHA